METLILNIENKDYKVLVIRKKVKRVILKVDTLNNISITCNRKIRSDELLVFLNNNLSWITKKIEKNNKRLEGVILDEDTLYFLGKPYLLVKSASNDEKVIVAEKAIYYDDNCSKEDVINYFSFYLIERFKNICAKHNVSSNVVVKKYKSRWGCCKKNEKTIYLNNRLICLPVDLIDYVIYHEITHYMVFNHSKLFYDELKKFYPDFKNASSELKKYSFVLK